MRDIEAHASTDTSVELGGVLLGGQYQDADGRPFVVVTDSLRAQHFEATKGSFKFTHETWEQISRERDEFPEKLQMVGWYHTHPDWGVFLSSMDMFICDNFFNRPLDLALVVDPCRGDRGMFQWTGRPQDRIRRTGGFYLIASRFRRQELEFFAAQLEGKLSMPTTDPRFGAFPIHMSTPAPVVNIAESRNSWQGPLLAGMLLAQFLLLGLLAWKLLDPLDETAIAAAEKDTSKEPTVAERIDHLRQDVERRFNDHDRVQAQQEAQKQILQALVAEMKGGPPTLVEDLTRQKMATDLLESALAGQQALLREKDAEAVLRGQELEKTKNDRKAAESSASHLEKEKKKLAADVEERNSQIKELVKAKTELEAQVAGKAMSWQQAMFWVYIGLAAVAGAAIGAVGVVAAQKRTPAEGAGEDSYEQDERPPIVAETHDEDGRPAEGRSPEGKAEPRADDKPNPLT
jgi:proteasome lid subunit RPN8/RPN11